MKYLAECKFLKTDAYNKFLIRVSENTKFVHGKTFIPTNNYDMSYLKQWKSNPSLWLLSYLIQTFVKEKNYVMIVECLLLPLLNFKFSGRTFYILWNEAQCVVRIEAVVFTHLTKVTRRNFHCRQTSGFTTPLPPPPSPAHCFCSLHSVFYAILEKYNEENNYGKKLVNLSQSIPNLSK